MSRFCNIAGGFAALLVMVMRAMWVFISQPVLLLSAAGGSQALAESVQLSGITAAIGCAASGNGTGHMVCIEYSPGNSLKGVSWEGPPAAGGPEAPGTVDLISLPTPAGTLSGAPSCATTADGTGTVGCLVVSQSSNGFTFQGIAFSASTNVASPLRTLDTQPAAAAVGNPSCANGRVTATVIATVCAIVINSQVYGIAFEALKNTVHTTLLPLILTNVMGAPSCVMGPAPPQGATKHPVICAVRQGNGLLGFSFAYDSANTTVDAVTSAPTVPLPQGAGTFSGDPSCALRGDGAVSCAIVVGKVLMGIDLNPATRAASAYYSLGSSPDGSWAGSVACAPVNDFRANIIDIPNPTNPNPPDPNTQNANLVGCTVPTSTGNLYHVSFDPQAARTLGVEGPFAANFSSSISCLELAIDVDEAYCGGIGTNGTALGVRLPVGLTPPAVQAAIATLF